MPRSTAMLNKKVPLAPEWADILGCSSMTRAEFNKIIWENIRSFSGGRTKQNPGDGKLSWPIKVPSELQDVFGVREFKSFGDVARLQRRAFVKK